MRVYGVKFILNVLEILWSNVVLRENIFFKFLYTHRCFEHVSSVEANMVS